MKNTINESISNINRFKKSNRNSNIDYNFDMIKASNMT